MYVCYTCWKMWYQWFFINTRFSGLEILTCTLMLCSTLSWLSGADYQRSSLPHFWSTKLKWLALITEKKVDIWHSLLRAKTESYMAADQIQSTAKTLVSVGFMADSVEYFCLNYLRGNAENDLTTIAGRTAQFLLDLFKNVAANTGKSKLVKIIGELHEISLVRKTPICRILFPL